MKKVFKILGVFLLFILALVGFLFFSLSSQTMLNKIAQTAISQSEIDAKYESFEGDVFGGFFIKGFSYEDKIKADLKLKADLVKLKDGVLHIEDINLSNLWIDEEFLKTLKADSNESESESKSGKDAFLKKIIVDKLSFSLVDFYYDEYKIYSLDVEANNITYDMKKDIKAEAKINLQSNVAKADIKANIKDENYTLDMKIWSQKEFLATFLDEQNVTINSAPFISLKAEGDFKLLNANLKITQLDLTYEDIKVSSKKFDVDALFDIEKRDLKADVLTFIESNVCDIDLKSDIGLNIDDINSTLVFDLNSSLKPKIAYLEKFTKEQNVTIKKLPKLELKASGDFKNIDLDLDIDDGEFAYEDIYIEPKGINIDANYSLLAKELDAKIFSKIDSNIANFDLDADVFLNTDDINNTLKIEFLSHILPVDEFLKSKLLEQNITIEKFPTFVVSANGDFKSIGFLAHLRDGKVLYNSFDIEPKALDINGTYSLQKGDLKTDVLADINSNVADVDFFTTVSLNQKDINNTLIFNLKSEVFAQKRELKEFNISITKPTKISLDAKGDLKKIRAVLNSDGEILYDKIKIKPYIYDSFAELDLKSKVLKSEIFAEIISTVGTIKTKTKTSLNIEDINNTLKYNTHLLIKDTKEYKGIDLSSLGEITAKAKGSLKNLDADISSPKLKIVAKSADFDKFNLSVDTKKIYLGKIYKHLPPELVKSFVHLKSEGFYKLSNKEAKFTSTLRGLKYDKNVIFTDEFELHLKDEDIKISNLLLQAKGFKMSIEAQKSADFIKADIKNRAINAKADIKLDPFYIQADAKVESINELIKEINKLYPLDVGLKVDGSLNLLASMEGEDAKITLNSPKIEFQDGDMVDLKLVSFYNKERILLKNFDFRLKGFKPKEFNKVVKLKKDGLITFGENSKIDIELENLLSFKGEQKGDVTTGTLSAKDLILAYNGYGYTKLSTKLDMFQSTDKLAVTGFIEFKDSEITYESPFLDVSKDPDIIIVTDKSKQKEKPNDDFLQNTFLDLDIRSLNEMQYVVDAGEIEFKMDINVRKDLGSEPKITGKINVLDGQYDMADKRFQIEEGAIAFRGQEGSNPLLDLNVNYEEIEDIVIMIAIGGDKNRPKLVFSSKPMMSKKDIFSYLLFGMSVSESDGAATSANKAAEKIFGRAIAKDLARELNLDRLDMNRNTLGGIDVKAGKKINRKSIIYYQNRSNESSLLYERKISDKWSTEIEVGKQGQGVDLFYRRGYK